jgi:hypothetical protein
MAAATAIIVLETLVLVAMGVVWGVHLWAPEHLKKRLAGLRHRVFDNMFTGHPG